MEHAHNIDPKTKEGFSWYLCTWNNPQQDSWLKISALPGLSYATGQLEKGESGTVHLQFVLYFEHGKKFLQLKKLLPLCALFGKPPSAAVDIIAYCTKDETRIEARSEIGKKPTLRKPKPESSSSKYEATLSACKEGSWTLACAEHQVKHLPNLMKLESHYKKGFSRPDVCGHWIYGKSGTGKSTIARTHFGPSVYDKAQNKWFDNYAGENTILIDDFDDKGTCLSHYLKRWADKFECTGELKGGHVRLYHSNFVITSQYSIGQLFPNDAELQDALKRRFKVYTVKGDYPDFELVPYDDSYMRSVVAFINN